MGCKTSKDAVVRNTDATSRNLRLMPEAGRSVVGTDTITQTVKSPSRPVLSSIREHAAVSPGPEQLARRPLQVPDAAAPLVEVLDVAGTEEANEADSPTSHCCPALAARRRSRSLSTASEPDIFSICESSSVESMSRRWNRRRFVEEGRQEMASMVVNGAVFEAMIARRCELEEDESSHVATTRTTSATSASTEATGRSALGTGCCGAESGAVLAVPVLPSTPRLVAPIPPAGARDDDASETATTCLSESQRKQQHQQQQKPLSPTSNRANSLHGSGAASPFSSRAVNTASSPFAIASTHKQSSLASSDSQRDHSDFLESDAKSGCAESTSLYEVSLMRSAGVHIHEASLVVRQIPRLVRATAAADESSSPTRAAVNSMPAVVLTPAKQVRRADPSIVSVAQGALRRSAMQQANFGCNSNTSSRSASVASCASRTSAGAKARCNPQAAEHRGSGATRRGPVTSKRDRRHHPLMQQEKYEQMCALFERTLTHSSTLDAQLNAR